MLRGMKLVLNQPGESYTIHGYRPGVLMINGEPYTQSLAISATQLIPDWRPQTIGDLQAEDFAVFEELEAGLILLGTGAKQIFPAIECYAPLLERNIAVEIMDTPAACRTFNILVSEGRPVAAGLMMI